jgi:hypothetical protein
MIKVDIQSGSRISESFIRKWNKVMKITFDEDEPLKFKNRNGFSEDIFFIVKDQEKIVSVGRLIKVRLFLGSKRYDLMGIADVVSLIKRKGYGKILMNSILEYLKKNKKSGIGFCERKNDIFYQKSGFNIKKNLARKFIYLDPSGKKIEDKDSKDLIYFEGKDKFVNNLLANLQLNIALPRAPW